MQRLLWAAVVVTTGVLLASSLSEAQDRAREPMTLELTFDYESQTRSGEPIRGTQQLTFRTSFQWRSTLTLQQGVQRKSVCDGKFVWSWRVLNDTVIGDVRRLSVERIDQVLGADGRGGVIADLGIMFLGDPSSDKWRSLAYNKGIPGLAFVGEEKLAETITRAHTTSAPRYKFWFGKDDGIIRKQVLYTKEGKEWLSLSAKKVVVNPVVDHEKLFSFESLKDNKIVDWTDEFIGLMKMNERPIRR